MAVKWRGEIYPTWHDALEAKDARIAEIEANLKDIEILSDRLEAPEYVKQIHALAISGRS